MAAHHEEDDDYHIFKLTTFKSPTFCKVCKGMLYGMRKQGLKCERCKKTCHEKCQHHPLPCAEDTPSESEHVDMMLAGTQIVVPSEDPVAGHPRWPDAYLRVLEAKDLQAKHELARLRRLYTILQSGGDPQQVVKLASWAIKEEVGAVIQRSENPPKMYEASMGDIYKWGKQKIPEVTKLGVADMKMTNLVSKIRRNNHGVTHIIVDLYKLTGLHPVTAERPTANQKTNDRADAAKAAFALIENNGLVVSEHLVETHDEMAKFRSITGFECVYMGPGEGPRYLVFEGNGRMVALKRAFGPEVGIRVECRQFDFFEHKLHSDICKLIDEVRHSNGYHDKMDS